MYVIGISLVDFCRSTDVCTSTDRLYLILPVSVAELLAHATSANKEANTSNRQAIRKLSDIAAD